MPERPRLSGMALLALALLLVTASGLHVTAALALAWLAPVPMLLGIALLRGSRGADALLQDAGRLALRWAGGAIAAWLLLGWPLAHLLAAPSLGRSLLLAAAAGSLLIGLWWQWPEWHLLARCGGEALHRARPENEAPRHAWRGLLRVALPSAVLLAVALLLAWPGLLAGHARLLLALADAVLLPLAALVILGASRRARLHGLPVVEMRAAEALDAGADADADADAESVAMPDAGAAAGLPAAGDASGVAEIAGLNRQLYLAARNGRVERALALLASGADPHAAPEPDARDRRRLAVLAAVLPDLRLLRALIERGVDVNASDDGMTPLLAATRDSWHGRPEAVMTLLTNGADPRRADADGNTPLHHAARSADPGVAALLRDAGAEIDALNHAGLSPLGSACACGNWRLARFLLERGAKAEPANGQPALLAAAGGDEDDPAGVQLLLRHKANVNACDARGRGALHEAAAAGHLHTCETLLAAGAAVTLRDGDGGTPVLDAVRGNALPVLELLLEAGADPQVRAANGGSALHLACATETPSLPLVQRLLQAGLDPRAKDAEGRSALDLALAAGHWRLVAELDPSRPLPTALEGDEAALAERPPQLLLREALLERAGPGLLAALMPRLQQGDFDALLCDPEVVAEPDRLDWLLRQGANPEARLPGQRLPLAAALARGKPGIACARRLLAHGAAPAGAGMLAGYLDACLGDAERGEREAFASELLARGADPFAASAAGDPPLLLAVRLGWLDLLRQLLALGVAPDACDSRGMTGLHLAAAQGRKEALKALLAAGANPGRRAADGQTPLGLALASGQHDLADWLDWRGWPLPLRPLQPADLPAAAIAGDLDAVRRLLDLGFAIDTGDSQGCTALLRAAGGGHRALVDYLLSRGADPRLGAATGATALSAAVSMRHLDIVERLLAAGSELEQRLPGDVTVLMLAAALGLPELVSRLLQAGADLHAVDAQGLTPLHCAALYGFTARDRSRLLALLDGLLLAGADLHREARSGATPLLLLLGARAEPGTPSSEEVLLAGLELLLDEGARLDVCDSRGLGPLHLAALHGLPRVLELLLRAGADPGLRDHNGRNPRDVALLRGYVDIAASLAAPIGPPPTGMSMARFLRD